MINWPTCGESADSRAIHLMISQEYCMSRINHKQILSIRAGTRYTDQTDQTQSNPAK